MVKFLDNNSGFAQWNANRKSPMSRRSRIGGALWWMIIFLISWWLVSIWSGPRQKAAVPSAPTPIEDISHVPVTRVGDAVMTADVRGLGINNIALHDFKSAGADTPVVLLGGDASRAVSGLMATSTTAPTATTVWKMDGNTMTWHSPDGVEYNRAVVVDQYVMTITDTVHNRSGHDIHIAPYGRIIRENGDVQTAGVFAGALARVDGRMMENDWRDLDRHTYAYTSNSGFAGFADQYWETIMMIDAPDQTIRMKKLDGGDDNPHYQIEIAASARRIASGDTDVFTTRLYTGPRSQAELAAAASVIPGISKTMDYGWFWFLSRPMLWALNALNAVVMNYGVAIILLTIALRLLMWPLTRKSYASMMAMQKMQPEMARIQKQFANDKPRMQMEMMRLYKTHKTSPMSGCLPMLIQIPIFFALYKALLISVQMRSAHFLWISDLAVMDPYFILPILMGATMWWQQRLQTASVSHGGGNDVAAQTQKMMKWMPILFTIMFAWMPAGLVLYWTVSNLFGIVQMFVIKRASKRS